MQTPDVTRDAAPVVDADRTPSAPAGAGFRTDIEGLRAIAVVAVVAYHLHLTGFSGGFVGVDVFFVISGYLITSHLVRDAAAGRRVRFREFYARRARRILPAATVGLVATIGAAMVWQNPLQLAQTTGADARSAALFFANVRFESQATDYLAEAGGVSLFQQFWSLSVEEQFYLLWPTLMMVAVLFAARATRSIRKSAAIVLAALVAGSFGVSWYASLHDPIPAFYLLQSRAWEMGVGALLAVAGTHVARVCRPLGGSLALVGAAGILGAIVLYSTSTTWPGVAAVVPVVGTAMVIAGASETRTGSVARLLAVPPMQIVGRYSYSIYLWHWPLVVLIVGTAPSLAKSVAVVAATAVLAAASFHFVEHPVRRSPWLRAQTNVSLCLGLVLILVAVAASFLPKLFEPALDAGRPSTAPAHMLGAPPVPTDFVPSDIVPRLVDGTSSVDPFAERNVECLELGQCVYGDPDADARVVLFGDSHAGQWAPALADVATSHGWRVDRLTRGGCSSLTATGVPACGAWVRREWDQIEALDPDLVVVSNASDGQFRQAPGPWEDRARATLRQVPDGLPLAVLSETPRAAESVPECLSEHLRDVSPCEPTWPAPRTVAINDRLASLAGESGATFVDLTPTLCLAERCPAVAGNVLVYRDAHHVTTAFATSRADDLYHQLAPLLV